MLSPSANSGAFSRKKGPSRLVSVPAASRPSASCITLTSRDRPSTSESRMNSCRKGVQAWPTAVRKAMPASHSSGVSSTSRAKSCRWRTAAAITSRSRASGVSAICARTSRVTPRRSRSCMAVRSRGRPFGTGLDCNDARFGRPRSMRRRSAARRRPARRGSSPARHRRSASWPLAVTAIVSSSLMKPRRGWSSVVSTESDHPGLQGAVGVVGRVGDRPGGGEPGRLVLHQPHAVRQEFQVLGVRRGGGRLRARRPAPRRRGRRRGSSAARAAGSPPRSRAAPPARRPARRPRPCGRGRRCSRR